MATHTASMHPTDPKLGQGPAILKAKGAAKKPIKSTQTVKGNKAMDNVYKNASSVPGKPHLKFNVETSTSEIVTDVEGVLRLTLDAVKVQARGHCAERDLGLGNNGEDGRMAQAEEELDDLRGEIYLLASKSILKKNINTFKSISDLKNGAREGFKNDYLDDLESLLYTFYWIVFGHPSSNIAGPLSSEMEKWSSDDPQTSARAKAHFLSRSSRFLPTPGIWAKHCMALVCDLQRYFRIVSQKKLDILKVKSPEKAAMKRVSLLGQVDKHFSTVIGYFETALKAIGNEPQKCSSADFDAKYGVILESLPTRYQRNHAIKFRGETSNAFTAHLPLVAPFSLETPPSHSTITSPMISQEHAVGPSVSERSALPYTLPTTPTSREGKQTEATIPKNSSPDKWRLMMKNSPLRSKSERALQGLGNFPSKYNRKPDIKGKYNEKVKAFKTGGCNETSKKTRKRGREDVESSLGAKRPRHKC